MHTSYSPHQSHTRHRFNILYFSTKHPSPPIFCITVSSFRTLAFYPSMADRQVQAHTQRLYGEGGVKTLPQKGPSASKVVAVVTLLPLGGTLLALSGLTLAGTLFGLAITTPIFIIFSPVLVPAALAVGLSVLAFMASGAFGVTGLSSLSWVYNCVRRATGSMPEQIDQAKKRMQDMASYVGQKTKDLGQEIQTKAQDQPKRT